MSFSRSFPRSIALLLVVSLLGGLAADLRAEDGTQPAVANTYKKSWMYVVPPDPDKVVKAGDPFDVKVEYYLDPTENSPEGTSLTIMPLGPWIDNPDGVYNKKRGHIPYPGLVPTAARLEPGKGEHTFTFKADSVYRYNGLQFLCKFRDGDKHDWPWEMRGGGPHFTYEYQDYELATDHVGGLFTYDDPVKVQLLFRKGAVKGDTKTLTYSIYDTSGATVASSTQDFTVGDQDTSIEITPAISARGTFVLEGTVDGWGTRDVVFARIPDCLAITKNGPTQFGGTNLHSDAECKIARKLGLTTARLFWAWATIQPGKDTWIFDPMDKVLDANKANGLHPWICITGAPNWLMTCPAANVGFEPFPFHDEDIRDGVATMTKRWKDLIIGWEWLNEIVPGGKSADPVGDYLRFCSIATQTAKGIAPNLRTLLAGGLWPRGFRNDLLHAGVAKYVDEVPVHYSDMGGVLDARDDLDAVEATGVAVTDDESSNGETTWNRPSREMIKLTGQSQWGLDHWPDELVAGATHITIFAGWTDPCGDWSYIIDEHTPRPYAATIAVLTAKLAGAKPIGKFYLGDHSVFHLFERDGKPVLIASTSVKDGEKISFAVGSEHLVVTDYQGNETPVTATGGTVDLALKEMRVFVEGGDLEVLKAYCAGNVGDGKRIEELRKLTILKGDAAKVPCTINNSYADTLEGSVTVSAPDGWPPADAVPFSVKAGGRLPLDVPITPPAAVLAGNFLLKAVFTFKNPKLPVVTKNFSVAVITREMVGNLLKNSGFEVAGKDDATPAEWSFSGKTITREPSGGGLGLGGSILKFEKAAGWTNASQKITPPPGQSYLYSAWVWNHDMGAGSNITQLMTDGTHKDFYAPAVFMSAASSSSWHLYTCRTDTPANLKDIVFTPVVKGDGWAMYDNMRVTLYEGSNYAAEVHKAKTPIHFDAKADAGGVPEGWDSSCPIPLLCENQLVKFDKSYQWTPDNLSGVAYMMWDDKSLYLRVEVIDDKHIATTTNDDTLQGDSLAVAISPYNRATGKEDKAFVYYISSASPGGGSGACTLYRPAAHCGGLPSGQLAQNSSVYDVSVKTTGTHTVYLIRMPWSDLGGINPAFGSKFGLSLMLNDNDGAGRAAAMVWGDGLVSNWSPANFGIATLVDE